MAQINGMFQVDVSLNPIHQEDYTGPRLLTQPNRQRVYNITTNQLIATKVLAHYQFNLENNGFNNLNSVLRQYGINEFHTFDMATYIGNFPNFRGRQIQPTEIVPLYKPYFILGFGPHIEERLNICICKSQNGNNYEMALCVDLKKLILDITPVIITPNDMQSGAITYPSRFIWEVPNNIASPYMEIFSIIRPDVMVDYNLGEVGHPLALTANDNLELFNEYAGMSKRSGTSLGGRKRRKTKKRRHSRRY